MEIKAPAKAENIKPTIMSAVVDFIFLAMIISTKVETNPPTKAEIISTTGECTHCTTPNTLPLTIAIATPNPAKEDTPKTEGPAKGFLKYSWSTQPDKDKEIPVNIAESKRGTR